MQFLKIPVYMLNIFLLVLLFYVYFGGLGRLLSGNGPKGKRDPRAKKRQVTEPRKGNTTPRTKQLVKYTSPFKFHGHVPWNGRSTVAAWGPTFTEKEKPMCRLCETVCVRLCAGYVCGFRTTGQAFLGLCPLCLGLVFLFPVACLWLPVSFARPLDRLWLESCLLASQARSKKSSQI